VTQSNDSLADLQLRLGDEEGTDPELLERLTVALLRDLRQVSAVEKVSRPSASPAPEGTRAVDLLSIGALILTLAKTPGALRAATGAIQAWLSGQPSRSVKLELDGDILELTGVSSGAQEQLISHWIARQTSS
jgi:hypothetical protein